jgi:hypothetical protein
MHNVPTQYEGTVNPELTNCEEAIRMVCLLPSSGPKNTGGAAVQLYQSTRNCAADELRIIIPNTPRSRAQPGIRQGTLIGQPFEWRGALPSVLSSPPLPSHLRSTFPSPSPSPSLSYQQHLACKCQIHARKKPPAIHDSIHHATLAFASFVSASS